MTEDSPAARWFDELKLAGGILAALGVLGYGLLRLAYVQFYWHFDALPEDAGLGKTELLSQALVGPVVLLIVAAVASILLLVLLLFLNSFYFISARAIGLRLVRYMASRTRAPADVDELVAAAERSLTRLLPLPVSAKDAVKSVLRLFRPVAAAGTVLALAVTVGSLFISAHDAARGVLESPHQTLAGRSIGVGSYSLPILDVRALAATVVWVGSGTTPSVLSTDASCLMYLGQTSDTVLVYDAAQADTIRLQPDDVVVAIHTQDTRLPGECS